MRKTKIRVIDLFAGPGGLGEGLAAFSPDARTHPYDVVLSIEKDPHAHATLMLRKFFRAFPEGKAPDLYYEHLAGNLSREQLYDAYPEQAAAASQRAWHAELGTGGVSHREVDGRIRTALSDSDYWILVGGPPCQAYSLAGRSRNKGVAGYRPEGDQRHFLYKEYLRTLARWWPPVFLMENVKGLLSSSVAGEQIIRRILTDLQDPLTAVRGGPSRRRTSQLYDLVPLTPRSHDLLGHRAPQDFIVRCEDHGVPQSRHRLLILGIRRDLCWDPQAVSLAKRDVVPASAVLRGLPRLRSGISKGADSGAAWLKLLASSLSSDWIKQCATTAGEDVRGKIVSSVEQMRLPRADRGGEFVKYVARCRSNSDWFVDERLPGVLNHSSRGHRADDLHRYLFASSFAEVRGRSPLLADFPAALVPRHSNVAKALAGNWFADRFRVQLWSRPSTTVVSHISKDGHYYIHPDPTQCRSLTVREAARLQTFPDNYLFSGPRTSQYIQVGNAVPPLLAAQAAEVVYEILKQGLP